MASVFLLRLNLYHISILRLACVSSNLKSTLNELYKAVDVKEEAERQQQVFIMFLFFSVYLKNFGSTYP